MHFVLSPSLIPFALTRHRVWPMQEDCFECCDYLSTGYVTRAEVRAV